MLRQISELFFRIAPQPEGGRDAGRGHTLQLAIAVLLIEVMRADPGGCALEQAKLRELLAKRFSLSDDETERLIELAELRSNEAHDLHSFTEVLNQTFEEHERQKIFEELWHLAYADGRLDAHEHHLMRRLADLLHIRHAAFVGTKIKASQSTKLD